TLTVVIPAYNEAGRILPYLVSITAYLGRRARPYELIVVDDGSTDGTAGVVERYADQDARVSLIRRPTNQGKGAATRAGMLAGRGELRLLADADGATPIEEFARLERAIADGFDLAIGSRLLASRDPRYRVHARWHRSVLGGLFNRVVQHLGLHGLHDTQCGFKLFRGAVAADLFGSARIDGYGFD